MKNALMVVIVGALGTACASGPSSLAPRAQYPSPSPERSAHTPEDALATRPWLQTQPAPPVLASPALDAELRAEALGTFPEVTGESGVGIELDNSALSCAPRVEARIWPSRHAGGALPELPPLRLSLAPTGEDCPSLYD